MAPRLRMLVAQQTTPDEVVLFLLLTVVAALVLAFVLYALLLTGFWRWRLRGVASIRALLFPRLGQLRAYAPEYALVTLTSLLLSLTIVERNDVVQMIHGYEIERLPAPAAEAIRTAMPFRSVDDADLQAEDEAGDPLVAAVVAVLSGAAAPTAALAEVSAAALLRPMLAAGEGGRGLAALQAIAGELGPSAWSRVVNRRTLLGAAVLLLLLYAAWLAWSRGRAVETDPDASVDYRRLAGRLAVPALCVALLLSAATRAGDPDRYARSALATAGLVDLNPAGAAIEQGLRAAMARQAADVSKLRYLVAGSDEIPSLADLAARIDAATRQVDAVDASLAALQVTIGRDRAAAGSAARALERRADAIAASAEAARVAADAARVATDAAARRADALDRQLEAVRADLGRLEATLRREAAATAEVGRRLDQTDTRVAGLAEMIRALRAEVAPTTGILFVAAQPEDTYRIQPRAPNARPISGEWTGAHALPAGVYVVSARGRSQVVTLAAGDAATVRFPLPRID